MLLGYAKWETRHFTVLKYGPREGQRDGGKRKRSTRLRRHTSEETGEVTET